MLLQAVTAGDSKTFDVVTRLLPPDPLTHLEPASDEDDVDDDTDGGRWWPMAKKAKKQQKMNQAEYFRIWYPLPVELPDEIVSQLYDLVLPKVLSSIKQ